MRVNAGGADGSRNRINERRYVAASPEGSREYDGGAVFGGAGLGLSSLSLAVLSVRIELRFYRVAQGNSQVKRIITESQSLLKARGIYGTAVTVELGMVMATGTSAQPEKQKRRDAACRASDERFNTAHDEWTVLFATEGKSNFLQQWDADRVQHFRPRCVETAQQRKVDNLSGPWPLMIIIETDDKVLARFSISRCMSHGASSL
ncbi:hypothetical protein C8F04DRAFT_1311882 [Mycena alexandri]|uniref:Uncharacterized protein n=1 Tax=Mycena alexandri TaxID=1745969 RepID=A0AAD6S6G6_9AGAR|nr:hypothetical protein C8F04DRAFT_1311882 [Mycena alexandri]